MPENTDVENFQKVSRVHIESADDFQAPLTRDLYEWWQSHQPKLPQRHNFRIEENWKMAANLYLIECLGEGEYLYRLNGEDARNLIGKNQAGNNFNIEGEAPELVALAKYLDGICTIKQPIRCTGTLAQFGRPHIQFESVDCPLVDDDGKVIFILGLIIPL